MSERVFDIKQAAEELGYTRQYVRMLIQDGKILAEQIPISPGARVTKYVMTEAAISDFKASVSSRSTRADNRTKWIVYASFEEMHGLLADIHEDYPCSRYCSPS